MQKSNLIALGVLALLGVAAWVYHQRTVNTLRQQLERKITQGIYEKQVVIDSLSDYTRELEQKFDSIESEKNVFIQRYNGLLTRLRELDRPRYFRDATFISESHRIAESRYRHSEANDTTGSQ